MRRYSNDWIRPIGCYRMLEYAVECSADKSGALIVVESVGKREVAATPCSHERYRPDLEQHVRTIASDAKYELIHTKEAIAGRAAGRMDTVLIASTSPSRPIAKHHLRIEAVRPTLCRPHAPYSFVQFLRTARVDQQGRCEANGAGKMGAKYLQATRTDL